jgi:hypothetical protein
MKQKSNQTDETKIASLKIETLPLASLKPHPRNPRKHPEKDSPEWKVLEASLKHDYFDPIVWNVRNGQLVSGHLRTKVLSNMGFESADVVVVDYDEPTHIARLMAANKAIGENDLPKMQELFGELKTVDGFDMAVAGFTLPEIANLFGDEATGDDSEDSESGNVGLPLEVEQVIKGFIPDAGVSVAVGDAWRLGEHTLFCEPVISGPRDWIAFVNKEGANRPLLIRPSPHVLASSSLEASVVVEPVPFHAELIISNFIRVNGPDKVVKIS